jgi:DNA-binding transcriptional MerR regulator
VAEEKKYGIGEVQELLRKEFPDITISKIRFLEKEGLINPERTPSGYRKYSKANIKQLSYILRLQREEYLPLSVIKRKIQDLKAGKVVAGDLTVMSGQAAEPALTGAVPVSYQRAHRLWDRQGAGRAGGQVSSAFRDKGASAYKRVFQVRRRASTPEDVHPVRRTRGVFHRADNKTPAPAQGPEYQAQRDQRSREPDRAVTDVHTGAPEGRALTVPSKACDP